MSRHRAPGPLLVEPASEASSVAESFPPAGGVLADLLGHTEVERLCGLVLAFPHTAERVLNERRVPDLVLRSTLRAETALRLNRPREALILASHAVERAMNEDTVDPARLLPALAVLADAAVVADAPDALGSCLYLIDLAGHSGDEQRAAIAAGLHAVAVYQQQGCRQALHLLDRLRGCATDVEVVAAVTEAHAAVERRCAHREDTHWPPTTLPVITAGGRVQAALTRPFLADRVQRWPGIHDCAASIRSVP